MSTDRDFWPRDSHLPVRRQPPIKEEWLGIMENDSRKIRMARIDQVVASRGSTAEGTTRIAVSMELAQVVPRTRVLSACSAESQPSGNSAAVKPRCGKSSGISIGIET